MSKGYAEGSALEERLTDLERAKRGGEARRAPLELAVFGSTADEPAQHFLGWADEVDPDELFESGRAWGITVLRERVD